MKVSVGYKYLSNLFNIGKEKPVKEKAVEKIADNIVKSGLDIISAQNKEMILRRASNYVEPLQKEFKSTKEMFAYAKKRCLDGIKENYEHSLIMDTKNNKIIGEFKGDSKSCDISILKEIELDSENTALMHGHPKDYPLSHNDICCIKTYNINQVIAIDEAGEFSLVYKKPAKKIEKKGLIKWYLEKREKSRLRSEFVNYSAISAEDYDFCKNNPELYKRAIDYTLRRQMPKVNMRYVTNYKYLIENYKKSTNQP